jgi:two-component system response regulator (stage 0 sporulation protein F)
MKILVVDDEVEVASFLCDFLKRLNLTSLKANCGKEALEVFTSQKPDWVLLDVKMPDIDGIEVLKKMKEINPEVNAIMITGRSDDSLINEAKALGARDYLIKPVDLDDLRTKIKTYILKGK